MRMWRTTWPFPQPYRRQLCCIDLIPCQHFHLSLRSVLNPQVTRMGMWHMMSWTYPQSSLVQYLFEGNAQIPTERHMGINIHQDDQMHISMPETNDGPFFKSITARFIIPSASLAVQGPIPKQFQNIVIWSISTRNGIQATISKSRRRWNYSLNPFQAFSPTGLH